MTLSFKIGNFFVKVLVAYSGVTFYKNVFSPNLFYNKLDALFVNVVNVT